MSTTFDAPATVATTAALLRDWAAREPDGVALREKRLGVWREITWAGYWELVQDLAHALLALGVEPGDRVAIHSENRPEWVVADVASVAVRAVSMGIYPTNPAAEVEYLLEHSGAKVLIAEDQEQVDKALAVADRLPALERIVYVEPRGVRRYRDPRLLSWEDLLAMGRAHRASHAGEVERRMAQSQPEDVVALVYTSGTTGPPKGAMLTAGNVAFAIESAVRSGALSKPPPGRKDMLLSYLPLAHVAERLFTVWFNLGAGPVVNFAESIDTVQQNLREVQPTIFLGVPRIWEKLHAGIQIRMSNASRIKRANYRLWVGAGMRLVDKEIAGRPLSPADRLLRALGNLLLYRALKDRIGMRCCRFAASGAAPVSADLLRFFMAIGVPMHEAYGMTENTAVATSNRPGRVKLGTVGEPYPGAEVRIDPETGEIQTRHPGTFAGYWRDEEATSRTFTGDGWLRTGDVGEWVDGTHLKITDRLKDIIITAGGKNIAPSEIENALKTSPYIKEAVVIGDRRPYLTALIGIELDTVGDWATRQGIPYTTYRDLSEKPQVRKLVQAAVDEVNQRFAQVETIKRFAMLPQELDHEDGQLTATQKVKRAAIAREFANLIEELYR